MTWNDPNVEYEAACRDFDAAVALYKKAETDLAVASSERDRAQARVDRAFRALALKPRSDRTNPEGGIPGRS